MSKPLLSFSACSSPFTDSLEDAELIDVAYSSPSSMSSHESSLPSFDHDVYPDSSYFFDDNLADADLYDVLSVFFTD